MITGQTSIGAKPGYTRNLTLRSRNQICRHKEEGGSRHWVAQPPSQRWAGGQLIEPPAARPGAAIPRHRLAERLESGLVIARQFFECQPENSHGGNDPDNGQHSGEAGPATRDEIIESGKPRGGQEANPPGMDIEGELAVKPGEELGYWPDRTRGDCEDDLGGGHKPIEAFAAKPAEAKLIEDHHAARAEERLQRRGNRMSQGEQEFPSGAPNPAKNPAKLKAQAIHNDTFTKTPILAQRSALGIQGDAEECLLLLC